MLLTEQPGPSDRGAERNTRQNFAGNSKKIKFYCKTCKTSHRNHSKYLACKAQHAEDRAQQANGNIVEVPVKPPSENRKRKKDLPDCHMPSTSASSRLNASTVEAVFDAITDNETQCSPVTAENFSSLFAELEVEYYEETWSD